MKCFWGLRITAFFVGLLQFFFTIVSSLNYLKMDVRCGVISPEEPIHANEAHLLIEFISGCILFTNIIVLYASVRVRKFL